MRFLFNFTSDSTRYSLSKGKAGKSSAAAPAPPPHASKHNTTRHTVEDIGKRCACPVRMSDVSFHFRRLSWLGSVRTGRKKPSRHAWQTVKVTAVDRAVLRIRSGGVPDLLRSRCMYPCTE